MTFHTLVSTTSFTRYVFAAIGTMLILAILASPLGPVFAQEVEATPPTGNTGPMPAAPTLDPVVDDVSTEPVATEPVPAPTPVLPEVVSPEVEVQKEKGPKKDKEPTEELNPVEPELEAEAMSARMALAGNPESETIGKYVAPEVSGATGALTYSYPIVLPPGRNGLTPDLTLLYDSSNKSRSSVFGVGWSISIPYIQRENRKGVDTIYDEDYFISSLDGELSDQGSGLYTPRVENGNFLKYEYSNDTWLVTDRLGTKYYFGSTTQAQQSDLNDATRIFSWMLEKVEDTNGNSIDYTYVIDQGQIYPDQISYNQDDTFNVKFNRTSRTSNYTSYAAGYEVVTRFNIDEIVITSNGSISAVYNLQYGDDLLESIQLEGVNGSQTAYIPETTFEYSANFIPGWSTTASPNYPIHFDIDHWKSEFIDVNGDGLQDVVIAEDNASRQTFINNGDLSFSLDSNWALPTDFHLSDNNQLDRNFWWVDINGDGLVDIVDHQYNNEHGRYPKIKTSFLSLFMIPQSGISLQIASVRH